MSPGWPHCGPTSIRKPLAAAAFRFANTIIDELSGILGTRPSAITRSGNGLHPYWPIDGQDGSINIGALVKRWGRLVTVVAESRGATVDTVFDLARMLRVPGTVNNRYKNGHRPVVRTEHDTGGPLTLAEIDERLNEQGVYEQPDDCRDDDEQLSDPGGWEFGAATCNYVKAMVDGIPTDGPKPGKSKSMGRHQWAASYAVRLTCARRLGCISETDWRRAQKLLTKRLAELRAASGEDLPKREVPSLFVLGRQRTAAKTDAEVRAELRDHKHPAVESDDSASAATESDTSPGENTYTDSGNAARLVGTCCDEHNYVARTAKWLRWDGMTWNKESDGGAPEYEQRKLADQTPIPEIPEWLTGAVDEANNEANGEE
jgi:hypothetical protein